MIADVIQTRENHFTDFDEYLERIAKSLASLLDAFPNQPAFHLAPNPIAMHAYDCPVLYQGSRSWDNDLLFAASNSKGICCDDYKIEDAGISNRRAWILYKHDSLCDFDGISAYTTFFWLSTAIIVDQTICLHVGFDWKMGTLPNRFSFEREEAIVKKKVLSPKCWRALHQRRFLTDTSC